MKKLVLLILIVPFLLGGCFGSGSLQIVSDEFLEFCESDKENVEKMIIAADQLKETWGFYSGCINALATRLSGKALEQKNRLDELYANQEWSNELAGETLVLRSLLVAEMTIEEIDRFLPGFRKLLGPFI